MIENLRALKISKKELVVAECKMWDSRKSKERKCNGNRGDLGHGKFKRDGSE